VSEYKNIIRFRDPIIARPKYHTNYKLVFNEIPHSIYSTTVYILMQSKGNSYPKGRISRSVYVFVDFDGLGNGDDWPECEVAWTLCFSRKDCSHSKDREELLQ